jgi:hypothetical protein
MANRIYKGPPVYGSAASTDASSPNTGVNYRNDTLTNASITAGLRGFNTNASSSNENEYLFRLSTLVDLIEKTGILGWNAETVYVAGSVVVADDKKIYQAVQGSTDVDPTTDPGTTWVDYITANTSSVSDASESVKGIIEIATNAEAAAAADDTKAITPAKLQAYIDANPIATQDASEIVKGVLKLATEQQLIDLDDDSTAVTPKKIGDRLLNASKIKIGSDAGETDQGNFCIAIGSEAGNTSQDADGVAIGNEAGKTGQGVSGVAIGSEAGNTGQSGYAVAIGIKAGKTSQGGYAVAIGPDAGETDQGQSSVAIGVGAGVADQPERSIAIGVSSNPSSQQEIYIGRTDSSVFIGDGNVQAVSDLRDKENVADSNLGLNFIMQLQPKSWTANTRDHLEPSNDSKRIKGSRPHYGFIAQDVKQAMNSLGVDFAGYCELVHAATPAHKERVRDRLTLRYQEFIGPMVKAMQEQQAMIDELKKEVQALKGGKDV